MNRFAVYLCYIKRVNNSAVDDESILFGTLAKNNAEFKDGLITNMIRKALRV